MVLVGGELCNPWQGESVAQKLKLSAGEQARAKITGFLLTSSLNTQSVLGQCRALKASSLSRQRREARVFISSAWLVYT